MGEWYRRQPAVYPTVADEYSTVQEPTVIYDTDPQILTGQTYVFKMWYTSGFSGSNNTCYAESIDGENWVKYGAVIIGKYRAFVFKHNDIYYMYLSGGTAGGTHRYYSNNGITWTDEGLVLALTPAGWDQYGILSVFVWVEGATWYMMYEGLFATGGPYIYKIGLATSPDGLTWTKSLSNPVLQYPVATGAGSVCNPHVEKIGANYWMWTHVATASAVPTELTRWVNTVPGDLTAWTQDPVALTLPRLSGEEGVNATNGQIADCSLVEVSGKTYIYYTSFPNQLGNNGCIKVAIYPDTIANLSITNEGWANTDPVPPTGSATSVPLATGTVSLINLRLSLLTGNALLILVLLVL